MITPADRYRYNCSFSVFLKSDDTGLARRQLKRLAVAAWK
jgi:hypothetical protein